MLRMSLLAAVAVIGVSSTAQSTEIYKDYVPSKAVWNVTMVKVVPNRIDDYLGGLKQSWVSGCEINKKMGVLEDCSIFISESTAGGPFNVMLVQKIHQRRDDGTRRSTLQQVHGGVPQGPREGQAG
jgi:hypothetical protein